MIDSHAHIYLPQFKEDRSEMVRRAVEAGLTRCYMPNVAHETIEEMLELEHQFPEFAHACMGLHPCSVTKGFERQLYEVEEWLGKRPFAAVGECGLDLYWDKSLFAEQTEALKIQLQLAKKYRLPIILHTREAFSETLELVKEAQDGTLTGVFHCFSGTPEEAESVIELGGFYLGIGGVATYKNGGLGPALEQVELKHLLLETDSPYLSPVPHRGKRNEPAFMPLVAQKVAEVKKISIEEVAKETSANAQALFKL